ncbi:hypothetical protein ES703_41568 [subsurface metagenome]
MKGLEQLKKNSKPVLVRMAKKLHIKVSGNWNKTTLAEKILEKQKLSELDETPVPVGTEPGPGKPERKPDFETLATEAPAIAPDSPQLDDEGPGGEREGAGRTPGLTDEKARVQRILKNQVPDPVVEFVVDCVFNLSGEPKKKTVEPTAEMIAVPVTNLMNYYFPNLNLNPLLQVWFDLGIGIKNLVVSRVQAMQAKEAKAKTESPESAEPGSEQKT